MDRMLVHHRSFLHNLLGFPQQFAGTHLYSWVERGTVRVKCLAQEHITVSSARARTRTASPRDKRTNHEATAPPSFRYKLCFIRIALLFSVGYYCSIFFLALILFRVFSIFCFPYLLIIKPGTCHLYKETWNTIHIVKGVKETLAQNHLNSVKLEKNKQFSYKSSLFIHPFSVSVSCCQQHEFTDSLRIAVPQDTLTKQTAHNSF